MNPLTHSYKINIECTQHDSTNSHIQNKYRILHNKTPLTHSYKTNIECTQHDSTNSQLQNKYRMYTT